MGTAEVLLHFNAGGEGFFQFGKMGNDEDLFKIILHRGDRFRQPRTAFFVLTAESLIDHQPLKP